VDGVELPEGALADHQYKDMTCEEIYRRLPQDDEGENGPSGGPGQPGDQGGQQPSGGGQPGQQPGQGKGKPDVCGAFTKPAPDKPSNEDGGDPGQGQGQQGSGSSNQLRDEWKGRVIQAAQVANASGVGGIPADMERLLDKMSRVAINWQAAMVEFVKSAQSARNDYTRSGRRWGGYPVIMPRKRADDVGTVIFVRDTSGSVNTDQVAEYSAMIDDCITEMNCAGIVIDCDAAIQAEYEIQPGEQSPDTAKGGGGTRFLPVFERAEELAGEGQEIAGIVYLTDLCNNDHPWPPSPLPDIPTLWLTPNTRQAPFGQTIQVED
jgi:predicted metal-dependent peptidase